MTDNDGEHDVDHGPAADAERPGRPFSLGEAGITRRSLLGAAGLTAAGGAFALNAAATTEPTAGDGTETGGAIVVLDLEPLARHAGDESAHARRLAAQREAYKDWLEREAPETEITYEYATVLHGLAVRLNGHGVGTLRKGPNVRYATRSQRLFPTLGRSLDLIDAPAAQSTFDDADLAGQGVKIAVLDTGIDHVHPFFRDDNLDFPEGTWPKGNGDEWGYDVTQFTNEKVIAAYVFWDEDLELDPGDENGHGTHVSGTAGGRADTLTDVGESVGGVAPGAWLGNYNVFAGGGSTASENVIAAVEQATTDDFDVINMSLGGPIDEPEDPLMEASENAIAAGVTVVSSAGNSGPEAETVTSPAAAPNVVAVGASSNDWAVFDSLSVTDGTDEIGDVPYAPGVQGGEVEAEILDAPIVNWADLPDLGSTTKLACDGQGNPNDVPTLSGDPVVLVQRGSCSFAEKAENIRDAGGRAMIVYNRDDAPPDEIVTMTLQNEVDLPSAFITNVDGDALVDFIRTHAAPTVDLTFDDVAVDREPNDLAGFSSRGPGPELEVKPELSAPGVNIYAAAPDDGWATLSGTSMASPHTAGSAALLIAGHPDWSVRQVRSALVNYADVPVDVPTGVDGPMGRGNGLLQVHDSLGAPLLADPATVSFGELGRNGPARRTTASRDLTLENVSGAGQTVDLAVTAGTDLAPNVSLSKPSVTLGAGGQATVTLSADASGQATGAAWGKLEASIGGDVVMTVPLWYRVTQ